MESAPHRRGALPWSLYAAAALLAAAWAAAELRYAANRPMWLDEWYSMTSVIREQGTTQLLLHGASGQGSPAPLDFILVKALDGARTCVRYLGLPAHAYFRLVGVLATAGAAVLAFAFALAGPGRPLPPRARATAGLFAALAAASFLLQPLVIHYAAEMRPYALWTALSLASAVSLQREGRKARLVSAATLVLLAMTATASIFQITALATAMFAVGMARRRRLADVCGEVAGVFALPLAVSLFYCLKAQRWEYPAEMCTWARFLSFWAARWWVPAAAGLAAAVCFRRKESSAYAVPSLGIILVYLMAPAIFWLTRSRGMFFADKQYIYHVVTLPVAFVTIAFALPAYGEAAQRRARGLVAACAVAFSILGGAYTMRGKAGVAMRGWQEWRRGTGIPSDPSGVLAALLGRELPRSFCFTDEASDVAAGNVRLVAEWLPVRYPSLPAGRTAVLLEARGDGSVVKALSPACGAEAQVPVVVDSRR